MGNTIARTKILKIISLAKHPINYSGIKDLVGNSFSRVTIYRMLIRLEKESLIYRFPDLKGDFRYSICSGSEETTPNNHFQCTVCDTVYKLEHEPIEVSIPDDYLVHTVQVLTAGICPECKIFKEN